MNRVTRKGKNWYQLCEEENLEECYYDKLYEIEDIEEELLKYNVSLIPFLKQVLKELSKKPTIKVGPYNVDTQIENNDLKIMREYENLPMVVKVEE